MEEKNSFDLYRVDQNILNSITQFNKTFGEHSDLCFMCLIYFAYNKQKDLFGKYVIDVQSFSKLTNVSTSKLNKVDPTKKRIKGNKLGPQAGKSSLPSDKYEWNTYLEQCLELLTLRNLPLTDSQYYDGKQVFSLRGIQILKDINVQYVPGKTNKVRQYTYELTKEIELAMVNRWALVDPKVYHKLSFDNHRRAGDKSQTKLYLYLCNLKNILYNKPQDQRIGTPNIQILFDLCPVNHDSDHYYTDKASKILSKYAKRDIIKHFNIVSKEAPHLGVRLVWEKNSEKARYDYKPIILFDFTDVVVHKQGSFNNAIITELRYTYLEKYETLDMQTYKAWLLDDSKDHNMKLAAYDNAYELVHKTTFKESASKKNAYITARTEWFKTIFRNLIDRLTREEKLSNEE